MITLYQFPAAWDVCSASGFCAKVEAFLRWQKIPHRLYNTRQLKGSPKGKVPFIDDEGVVIGDSELIIAYLCDKFHLNPDVGLTVEQKATARAIHYLCEEGLYRATSYYRFIDEAGWQTMRKVFFANIHPLIRWFVEKKIRNYVLAQLMAHGIARHTAQEITLMGQLDIDALSAILGNQPFFFGDEMHVIDITVFSVLSNLIVPPFDHGISQKLRNTPNLVAHTKRVRDLCFCDASLESVAA